MCNLRNCFRNLGRFLKILGIKNMKSWDPIAVMCDQKWVGQIKLRPTKGKSGQTSFCYSSVCVIVCGYREHSRTAEMKRSGQEVSKVSVAVYVAVVLFSMSTWMDVVGVWVEMPLFVTALPEGWSLPSYLAIIIQLANVGPAVYALIHKFQQDSRKRKSNEDCKTTKTLDAEVVLTLVIITVAALNIFMLSFLWPITSFIGGRSHSIVMLSQMVPTALTSCMTSLVFLPYMARFPSSYISAFYVGQGFSGLVPGLIGLIQGAGSPPECIRNSTQFINDTLQNVTDESTFDGMVNSTTGLVVQSQKPLFSVQVFLFCLTALFLVSLAAFCCLNFSKCGRAAMIGHISVADVSDEMRQDAGEPANGIRKTPVTNSDTPERGVHQMCQLVHPSNETTESAGAQNEQRKSQNCEELLLDNNAADASESYQPAPAAKATSVKMQNRTFVWLLIVVGVVNALSNGLLPSTESYTCLPYGYLVYTLAVRLSSVAASLASLSSMFLPRASVRVVFLLTLLGLVISVFHMVLALQSPNPVLRGHLLGDILVVSKSSHLVLVVVVVVVVVIIIIYWHIGFN